MNAEMEIAYTSQFVGVTKWCGGLTAGGRSNVSGGASRERKEGYQPMKPLASIAGNSGE
jgi:hypothetical protein